MSGFWVAPPVMVGRPPMPWWPSWSWPPPWAFPRDAYWPWSDRDGVTDGRDARPGEIGEWIEFDQSFAIAANTAQQDIAVIMGVLPPGDWTCWGTIADGAGPFQSILSKLSPMPAGFTGSMDFYSEATGGEQVALPITSARALTTVPSIIAFKVQVFQNTGGGTGFMSFMARRAR